MADYDLVLDRTVKAPPALVWEAWTKPEHLKQWFCPRPWRTTECRIDLRPGGEFFTRMEGPNGEVNDNVGIFLEIIPEKRLVTTDCIKPGWIPSAKPFMCAILDLEPSPEGTHYVATARHANPETMKHHEEMGFHKGWDKATDQMEELILSWERV
jgi:uncharacterized protein YndB with AHSA1/START domain